ncbi:MAG: sigma 54-interacting transcriptional regulator [Candidatus Entotheonellia bacterium]
MVSARLRSSHVTSRIQGKSPAIDALRGQIVRLAAFDTLGSPLVPTVLLQGETGTGKGLVARVLHDSGPRLEGPFLEVNCAAIPEMLLEAELFGFEAGAFTDAKRPKPGLFEAASGGTLFLDEIDALPVALQGKMLKAIEEKRVRRVGAVADKPVDIKLTVATHADLNARVADGRFRADLYYRLAVVVLEIPPLRERGNDVRILAQQFLRHYAEGHRVTAKRLSPPAAAWLRQYPWPGNVRELSHLMERVTLLHLGTLVDVQVLERLCLPRGPSAVRAAAQSRGDEQEPAEEPRDEAAKIRQILRRTEGNVAQAARMLGWSRKTLRYRMERYGIERPSRNAVIPSPAGRGPGRPLPQPLLPGNGRQEEAAEPQSVSIATPAQDIPQVEAPGWEQKRVAVLAIEVTWPATSMAEDPHYEPWTVTTRWEQRIAERVKGFGGIVLQRVPSLYLVAFGLPQTLEQLPQRALQAALALRRLVVDANAAATEEPCPTMRQAIHWGQLLVDVQGRDPTARLLAVGETLALPVRLLGEAAPGEILVSAQVQGLVEGRYELQACDGPVAAEPSERLRAYRVVSPNLRSSSLVRRGERPLSRFVGRDREMVTLSALLVQLEDSQGHVVGIAGEPGIGKSRLIDEFRRSLEGRRLTYLRGRCISYGNATPYLPVLDLLRHHCGITDTDDPEAIAAKVRGRLQAVGMSPDEWAPYLIQLLGGATEADRLAVLSPQMIRAHTIEALVQMSINASRQCPLIIEVEDLHWIDATSEEWLAALVERLAGAPLLVLVTYRPGYRPPWLDKSYATQMALPRLTPRDSLGVVQTILPIGQIPESLAQEILAKADGNPFFLEELARAVMEQGDARLPQTVPDTIHAVLAARIDRLPPAQRRLLQAAAVIGKDVTLPLLQSFAPLPEEELRRALRLLQAAEFCYETQRMPAAIYTFKHVLIREVAYQSLPQSTLEQYHQQIAQVVEERFPEIAATQPEWVAHHYTAANLPAAALPYWRRAGQHAIERSAYVEAISHLTQGLEVLKMLPDTSERTLQELALQTTLGLSLTATKGYAAEEVERAYARARELYQQVPETPQLFPLLWGLWGFYLLRGRLQTALELGQQFLAMARRMQNTTFLLEAHAGLGMTLFYCGELVLAREHLEQGLALYDPQQHRSHAFLYGQDPGLACLAYAAWTLWLLGYADQARQKSQQLRTLLQEVSHPFRLAYIRTLTAMLHYYLREEGAVQEQAEAVIALCTEHGFPLWLAGGMILQGWALAARGREEVGTAQIRQGLAAWQTTGAETGRPCWLLLLAETYLKAGRVDAGLSIVDEALAAVDNSGEQRWAAELYRLKGELLLKQAAGADLRPSCTEEVETCLRQAVNIAQRQRAKALELQAVMSLSRLWRRQGKYEEAQQLLAEMYGQFTEGFDTVDIRAAKRLLETGD